MASGRKKQKRFPGEAVWKRRTREEKRGCPLFVSLPTVSELSLYSHVSQIQEGGVGGNGGVVMMSSDGGEKA